MYNMLNVHILSYYLGKFLNLPLYMFWFTQMEIAEKATPFYAFILLIKSDITK